MIQEVVPYLYLIALIFSIVGVGLLDWTHKLALFVDARATVISVAISVGVFLTWDVIGIINGIFFRGDAPHLSGILLAPELPLEELFFLVLLSYNTLIAYRWAAK
ncbi:MAG: lycopene cyclase domain-containing protein [Actinobacteria bacterium]|nr:lycopene cyclase domain-containing protein [Actinomycetota bacterium]